MWKVVITQSLNTHLPLQLPNITTETDIFGAKKHKKNLAAI